MVYRGTEEEEVTNSSPLVLRTHLAGELMFVAIVRITLYISGTAKVILVL